MARKRKLIAARVRHAFEERIGTDRKIFAADPARNTQQGTGMSVRGGSARGAVPLDATVEPLALHSYLGIVRCVLRSCARSWAEANVIEADDRSFAACSYGPPWLWLPTSPPARAEGPSKRGA